jgi:DNA polymerase-1
MGLSLAFRWDHRIACVYLPFRHKFGFNHDRETREETLNVLAFRDEHKLPNVYHNSKFDITSLETLGAHFRNSIHYCTMLQSHLLNENRYSQSLDALVKIMFGRSKQEPEEMAKIKKSHGWGSIPSELMYYYALTDAGLCLLLHEHFEPEWEKEKLNDYWLNHKLKTIDVVRKMEILGVGVDTRKCEVNIRNGEMIMDETKEILGLNPASPKDLAKLLIDGLGLPVVKTTPGGSPCFDKEAMAVYDQILERQSSDTARLILTYRGWQKTVSSNYRAYIELLSPDGRLRPNYKLHGTKTGRFSCEKPNLQQIPRQSVKPWNGDTKKAFQPPEGYIYLEADYSQLELRLATSYAQDPSLIEVFNEGRDIFTEMSTRINLSRQDTKTFVYSTQYGAGIKRLCDVFGWTPEEAQSVKLGYKAAYPGFDTIDKDAKLAAKRFGKVKLWSGRYRHFMFPDSENHKALNSAIQGGAADIVEKTMHRLSSQIESDECRMVLQVHDSVVFQVKAESEQIVIPEIQRVMTNIEPDFGVKFAVDIHHFGKE